MDVRIVFLFFHERIPYDSIYETSAEVKFLQQSADTQKVIISATIRTIIMVRRIRLQAMMLVSAVFAAVVFCAGCRFSSGSSDKTTYEAPQADSSSGGITLSIVPVSGSSYINVYRREVSGSSYSDPVNVGEIKPADGSSFPASVIFTDPYAFSGTTYQYRARYYNSSYKVTEWSVEISGKVSGSGTYVYTVDSGAELVYSSEYKTLTISGTITSPTADTFDPKIALKTDSAASLFGLTAVSDGTVIHLTDILPSSFYNTDVSVAGILGETSSESVDELYTCYYWLVPSSITMVDGDGDTITSFQISSSSSTTDNDYSSPSANISKTAESAAAAGLSDYSD